MNKINLVDLPPYANEHDLTMTILHRQQQLCVGINLLLEAQESDRKQTVEILQLLKDVRQNQQRSTR